MNESNIEPQPLIVCAIATFSHFHSTLCLLDSFFDNHRNGKAFVLQVGGAAKVVLPNRSQIEIVTVAELNLPHYDEMRRKYNDFELCNALKPFLLRYIFAHTNYQKVCYLDSDLYVYANLQTEVWDKLDESTVLLTPHIVKFPRKIRTGATWRFCGAEFLTADLSELGEPKNRSLFSIGGASGL